MAVGVTTRDDEAATSTPGGSRPTVSAPVTDHESVDEPPAVTVAGSASKVTISGAPGGGGSTTTRTDRAVEPNAFSAMSV